jgi:hypothetical protein
MEMLVPVKPLNEKNKEFMLNQVEKLIEISEEYEETNASVFLIPFTTGARSFVRFFEFHLLAITRLFIHEFVTTDYRYQRPYHHKPT